MRIGVIGGLTRSETYLSKLAADAGHILEFHTGEISGPGVSALRSLVERSEYVIILMTYNSHQAVWLAKQAVRDFQRPAIVMRKCGAVIFRELMNQLGRS